MAGETWWSRRSDSQYIGIIVGDMVYLNILGHYQIHNGENKKELKAEESSKLVLKSSLHSC